VSQRVRQSIAFKGVPVKGLRANWTQLKCKNEPKQHTEIEAGLRIANNVFAFSWLRHVLKAFSPTYGSCTTNAARPESAITLPALSPMIRQKYVPGGIFSSFGHGTDVVVMPS
jgi:hypothetical protein